MFLVLSDYQTHVLTVCIPYWWCWMALFAVNAWLCSVTVLVCLSFLWTFMNVISQV